MSNALSIMGKLNAISGKALRDCGKLHDLASEAVAMKTRDGSVQPVNRIDVSDLTEALAASRLREAWSVLTDIPATEVDSVFQEPHAYTVGCGAVHADRHGWGTIEGDIPSADDDSIDFGRIAAEHYAVSNGHVGS